MTLGTAPTPSAVAERTWPVARVRIALLLLLLYGAASTARWAHLTSEWPARPQQDEISANDRRFAPLRAELPARGTVGYLGDPEPTGPTPREANAAALLHFRRYLLAQYALAPVVLIESTEPELVVGNFFPEGQVPAPDGLERVADYGEGLVLFRRRTP